MDNKFLLSICIPTYNRADIVYECVLECLANKYEWLEVVVTDNCSTDGTKEKLARIKDSRFKYFRNEKNIGYVNLSKCMTNGSGKYSLLLCDEDIFIDTDWNALKKELESAENVALFQFRFLDENGNLLIAPPERLYRKGQYDTLTKVHRSFAYSGAAIIKTDLAKKCWKEDLTVPSIWSLYSEIITPLYCALYGDYKAIKSVTVQRSKRSNTGTLDTTAWCGSMDEPYWAISSRLQQFLDWIKFFAKFNVDDKLKLKLAENVLIDSIFAYRRYCDIVNSDSKKPLFLKYHELILRDRDRYNKRWISASIEFYNQVATEFDKYFGYKNRSAIQEKKQLFKMILSFSKLYLKQHIKQLIRG